MRDPDSELSRFDRACIFIGCMCFVSALGILGYIWQAWSP